MKFFILMLLIPLFSYAEEPPEAEYPYPSQKKQDFDIEKPKKIGVDGSYYYESKKKKKDHTPEGVEKPYEIGDDGAYYYNNSSPKKKTRNRIEEPTQVDDDGTYHYGKRKQRDPKKINDVPLPDKVLNDGTYIYNDDVDRTVTNSFYFRGGVYGPIDFAGPGTNPQTYKDVYSDKSSWIINVDYEWKMFDFLGEFLLKFGTGVGIENGDGQFVNSQNPDTTLTPKEKFQFIIFPNTLSLSYKIKAWSSQLITPYVDAGPGYFTFWERRSDGDKNSFGGAPVLSFAGGMLISLSKFSSGTSLSNDYGVHEMYLDLQFKQIVGLDDRKDFTSSMITGGFGLGF